MIDFPLTKDDIHVSREEDGTLRILVGDEMNNFSTTAKGDKARLSAIKILFEMVSRKAIGFTEHDLAMKTYEFLMSEEND